MSEELIDPKPNMGLVEMSLRITKASYNKSESEPRKWTAIDSDVDEDLYKEKMSIELYKDFIYRIENNIPVPEAFKSAICEDSWCGGKPYLSIAHYKAGSDNKNVPGTVDSIFIDGTRLKSKGTLADNPMGRKVFDSLVEDLYKKKSGDSEHLPVRISIGFLDLEHKHLSEVGGQEFTFTRSRIGEICPLCAQGIGGKIYCKGQLIHLAMTRVPVNPRTEMIAERSMEIETKKQDAESILGELANELEEKSIASDILVVRSDDGSDPVASESDISSCYDPNVGEWNNDCVVAVMDKYMPAIRKDFGVSVKSTTLPKEVLDVVVAHMYKSNGINVPIVEDAMEPKVEKVEEVEKAVAGIPVKPFKHTQDGVTITGDVNDNQIASPVPAKADVEEDEKEEKKEMSQVDKAFALLQNAMKSGDVEEVNKAFGVLGTSVEQEFKPEVKPVDANDLAAIVRSTMEEVLAPIKIKMATLEAGLAQKSNGASNGVVQSKALSLNPGGLKVEDIIQRAGQPVTPQAPARKLTQIEAIARRSTGADR